jgi:hypothetical protein
MQIQDSVQGRGSASAAEARHYREEQEEKDHIDGKWYYEIVGRMTQNEKTEEANCWWTSWFETNQFIC